MSETINTQESGDGTYTPPTQVPSFFAPRDTTTPPPSTEYGDQGVYSPPTFTPAVPIAANSDTKWHCYNPDAQGFKDGHDPCLYAGPIHPNLLKSFQDNNEQPVYAVQRSVTIDEFGTKVSVWYPVNIADYLADRGHIPGEVRKVGLVQV